MTRSSMAWFDIYEIRRAARDRGWNFGQKVLLKREQNINGPMNCLESFGEMKRHISNELRKNDRDDLFWENLSSTSSIALIIRCGRRSVKCFSMRSCWSASKKPRFNNGASMLLKISCNRSRLISMIAVIFAPAFKIYFKYVFTATPSGHVAVTS